ncbi:MAG: GldG family protein [Deltaproteobacteria bacterium]|nr:GldG family protein [Deltaproteobacteria bacterium]
MHRFLNLVFRDTVWGWVAAGGLLVGLVAWWLLTEHLSKNSRTKVRTRATVFTAFVVADLMLFILLTSVHVFRWDLTRDKLYSLSPISREMASKLDDTVTVEVFFPEDVPSDIMAFRESLFDLLDEFRAAAGGQLVVKQLDPSEPGVPERAEALGIKPAPFQTMEADKLVTKEVMRGLAVTYKGRTERIPVIDREVGLEYQLTTLLKTLTGKPRKIGLLTGHKEMQGALDQPQFLETIQAVLSYYDVVTVTLDGGAKPVPEDVQALFLTTPTDPLSEAELYQIDQFVMRGGALAFLGNGFTIAEPPPQMQMAGQMQLPEIKPLDESLAKLLDHFGLVVGDDVVLDDNTDDGVRQRQTGLQISRGGALEPQYSLMTSVFWTKDVAEAHPVVFGITNPLVYQASTVDISEAARSRNDLKLTTLLRSPERSWLGSSSEVMFPVAMGGMPPQEPSALRDEATDEEKARTERGARPLMVAIEGPMDSYFAGKDVPAPATAEGRKDKSTGPVRILGLGSPIPIIPEALKGGLAGNPPLKDVPTLLLNTCDWLLSEKGLLQVRGKTAEPPPFKNPGPDAAHQRKVKWMLIAGWPVVFIAVSLGALVLFRAYRKGPAGSNRRSAPEERPARNRTAGSSPRPSSSSEPRPEGRGSEPEPDDGDESSKDEVKP